MSFDLCAEVVASVFADDFGVPLLSTCRRFRGNDTVLRAVYLTGALASHRFHNLLKNCNDLSGLERLARIVAERPNLHRAHDRDRSTLQFAVELGKFELVRILVAAGFSASDRWDDGSSLFSYLCKASDTSPAAADAALHVATLRAADGSFPFLGRAGGRGDVIGDTGLLRACHAGLNLVVEHWLSHDRSAVEALLHDRNLSKDMHGHRHTPFTAACSRAGAQEASDVQRAGATLCAALLDPLLSPTGVGGRGHSNLYWACWAGRCDTVRAWLQHPSVIEQWLAQAHGEDQTPLLAAVCCRMSSGEHSTSVIPLSRQCATLIGMRGGCGPSTTTAGLGPAPPKPLLYDVCEAGLHEVLQRWIADCRHAVLEVLNTRVGGERHTAFSIACSMASTCRDASTREATALCADILAALPECSPVTVGGRDHSYLFWACRAGRPHLVRAWLRAPEVTEQWLTSGPDHNVLTALSKDVLRERPHPDAVRTWQECVTLLGTSGIFSPSALDADGVPCLLNVSQGGLPAILQHWIETRIQDVLSVLHVPDARQDNHTAFTAACWTAWRRGMDPAIRDGARQCAMLLATLPQCDPTRRLGLNCYLEWACWAAIPTIVSAWLQHPDVTPAWLAAPAPFATTLLTGLCRSLSKPSSDVKGTRQCIELIGTCGKCKASTVDGLGIYTLFAVCLQGLDGIVSYWLKHDRAALLSVLHFGSGSDMGHTPFSIACASASTANIAVEQQLGATACATLFASLSECRPADTGGHGTVNLYWACRAGLEHIVRDWVKDPAVTEALLAEGLSTWKRPMLSHLCSALFDTTATGKRSSVSPASARACILALGCSGKCSPATVDRHGVPQLYFVCEAGLWEVLSYWLQHCPADVLRLLHAKVSVSGEAASSPLAIAQKVAANEGECAEKREGASRCVAICSEVAENPPMETTRMPMVHTAVAVARQAMASALTALGLQS